MLKLIVLLAFVANLNSVLTDPSPETTSTDDSSKCGAKIKCGPNQVYEKCPQTCPPRTCKTKDIAFRCKEPLKPGDPDCPPPGCRCANGYYSNDEGKCVLKNQCPKACKKNEEYQKCPNRVCREKTCNDLGYPLACYQTDIKNITCGEPACICQEGYVKDKNGICIPSRECPSCGGDPNAWSGCGTYCTRCSNYKNNNTACILLCRLNSCDCRPNYVYDEIKQKCVLPEQCSQCKANEEFSECPNKICREKTCDNLGFQLPCYQSDKNTTDCGEPSCICKEGYVKNKKGVCIPKEDCPSCGGDRNAKSGCGTFCNRCTKNYPCPKICKVNGCECRQGYVYDDTKKKCVLPTKCPKTCKKNEEYQKCPNRVCREKTCNDLGYPLACYQTDIKNITCGEPACICQEGYVKDKNGICIPSRECPSCGGDPNAWSGCGTYCTRCSNYKNNNTACILICRLNSCDCRPNYVYDEIKKKCVLPEQCPKCGPNETFSKCANAGCGKWNCSQVAQPDLCIDVLPGGCVEGCVCKSGYLRNAAGKCVSISECPSKEICPKPHEYYNKCPSSCPPRQCGIENPPTLVACKPPSSPDECNPSCLCEKNYYRNSKGDCVTLDECPKCGKNEVFDECPSSCPPRTCETKDRVYKCKAPLQPGDPLCPRPTCRCADNYYRNSDGKCVLKEECPKCGKNEVFDECPSSCPPRTCETKDRVYKCKAPLQPGDPLCPRPTCRCADNYYRNCDGKCVLKEECPPQCGLNEVPSDCGNNGCLPTCALPNLHTYCDPNLANCKPGCVCADGYLRDEKGVCIPKNKCPPKKNDPCLLAPEVGLCKAAIPKYYYDSTKKDCFKFIYGGCGGNDNKFDTKAECLEKCSSNNKKATD